MINKHTLILIAAFLTFSACSNSNDSDITESPEIKVTELNVYDSLISQNDLLLMSGEDSGHLIGFYPVRVFPREDGNLLVAYRRMPADYRNEESRIQYVIQSRNGEIVNTNFYSQPDRIQLVHYVRNAPMAYNAIHSFPFFPRSLFAVSNNDLFFAARSDQFIISVFDHSGELLRKIEHPVDPLPITRRELLQRYENQLTNLGEGVATAMIREAEYLPDHWPVLRNLLSDDEGRIWVSTVVEGFEMVDWWVLEQNGEVTGRFTWPINRPIHEIRNGHLYSMEKDPDTDLQEIVKYRIEPK